MGARGRDPGRKGGIHREKVLEIFPSSTSDEISDLEDGGLVNRTVPPDSFQGPALADAMEVDLGGAQGKKVNIGARNDAYGTGIAAHVHQGLAGQGRSDHQEVTYGPQQRSYDTEARQIVSGTPDAFLIVDTLDTYREGRARRWCGPAAGTRRRRSSPTASPRATCRGRSASRRPRECTARFRAGPNTGAAAEAFDQLYTKAPGDGRSSFDAQTFDAVILCYLAAVAAGSPDGVDMARNFARSADRAARSTPGRSFPMR